MNGIACKEPNCKGNVLDGRCQSCGAVFPDAERAQQLASAKAQKVTASVRALLEPKEAQLTKDDLLNASESLTEVVPDDYQAWRAQADLLHSAVRQLETRQIEPDESVKLLGIPMRESLLRDAAEAALRNCAHFAETDRERIALIDEANRVRRTTWF